jgi:hypothetical protein
VEHASASVEGAVQALRVHHVRHHRPHSVPAVVAEHLHLPQLVHVLCQKQNPPIRMSDFTLREPNIIETLAIWTIGIRIHDDQPACVSFGFASNQQNKVTSTNQPACVSFGFASTTVGSRADRTMGGRYHFECERSALLVLMVCPAFLQTGSIKTCLVHV